MSAANSPRKLYEIQVGVYADEEGVRGSVDGFARLLGERGVPHALQVAGPQETTGPGGMPLAEFYEELHEQWRIEHPEASPGTRAVHEIRVGVLGSREEVDALREELTRVLCPDPEHPSPCPIPWGSGWSGAGPGEDEPEGRAQEALLRQRYRPLLEATRLG
ncbi:hypothetical protein SLNWT_2118 [Streptomyces albus]|uniref:Uncharacterized protein n=1 Tax=Streptomyces albus (strain ATCC 21838 / DSM 41398 / FERM P-419 / JCM 4703 / NBRC 107858) TaxID=1081613 RepID=A0A0B5ELQ1_STRA4|nr:hypothetical protein SLNWT_2118 [Streptomyces albus]AOU76809.1 hypothetical protein SLNHY_2118 [Streptomyces albus]AYN32587.1 hypothetical protein DUI70_2084 [Streptomyces albus]